MTRKVPALLLLLALSILVAAPGASAQSDAKTLVYGVGLRVGGGPKTESSGNSIGLASLDVRPYIHGQIERSLKFTGNLDLNNGDGGRIHVLDAIAQFEPDDLINVWFGRFLPPSDRANLSGPYYQNAWNYPTDVNGYPSIYAGRADGAALWGQVGKGRFKYQAGFFTLDPNTPIKNAIYAGRLTFDFLDPEPGYYNSSTYYGSKQVLALGGAIQYQKKGGGTVAAPEDLLGFNLDLLFEKPLAGAGTVSLEGAYYNFNKGSQGQSFFALASYLFAPAVGIGRLQPMARYQHFIPSGGGGPTRTVDGGVNYIIEGHDARLAFAVQHRDPPTGPSATSFQLGVQIQR